MSVPPSPAVAIAVAMHELGVLSRLQPRLLGCTPVSTPPTWVQARLSLAPLAC